MPPNPQNLNPPWPKGVSGNTGGRPKKHSMQTELGKMLDAKPEVLRALISKGIQEALKGDFRYWKELYDRLDGKLATSLEITDKPAIDWSALDDECDTPPRKTTDTKGPKSLPESGQA